MRWLKYIAPALTASLLLTSCDNRPPDPDSLGKGKIDISVDETYRAVIEQHSKVFDSSYPEAKVTVHYKPEAECIKDFFDNKARIILVTRELTEAEKKLAEQKQFYVTTVGLAKDALAVIINNENTDSLMNIDQLTGILTGENTKNYTVVFDNQSSSLLRYINDSVLKGKPLGKNVFAAKNNKEVIDYVMKNPKAIGFTGLCDIVDSNDKTNSGAFIKNIRVVSLYNEQLKVFLQPYLAYLALKQYPLTRKLYYINKESYPGLGTGFANFLSNTSGQLIFAHAHLYPLKMEITLRDAQINNSAQ